ITVQPVNDAPVANNDAYNVNACGGSSLIVPAPGVLANDTDVDGDLLTLASGSVILPAHGTLVLNADGSFIYTPNPKFSGLGSFSYMPVFNFLGPDSFTSKAVDSFGLQLNVATVTINVQFVNHPPVANNDVFTLGPCATPKMIPAPGVLSNDVDVDGDGLTAF